MEDNMLDFETAMRDFAIMFPTMTSSKIEDVLRKHEGDVAKTIDELLTVTTRKVPPRPMPLSPPPTQPPPPLLAGPPPLPTRPITSPPPPYEEATSMPSAAPITRHRSSEGATAGPSRRIQSSRRSRMSVDDLRGERERLERLKRENERKLDRVVDEQQARILEDEQLALLIQRKELSRCMQDSIGQRRSNSSAAPLARRRSSTTNQEREAGPRVPEGPVLDEMIMNNQANERDIRERLKNLGKIPKARISQLASMIRREIS